MGILSFLKGLVPQRIPNPGALLDSPPSISELPKHEDFYGAGEPMSWDGFMPSFRYQGPTYWCTAYAGTSIVSAFDARERGGETLFSPMEMFYRSNGSLAGNYLINVGNAMKEFSVLEGDVPTKVPDSWNQKTFDAAKANSKASEQAKTFGKQFAVKSLASVSPNTRNLRAALSQSPVMVAVGIGKGYFDRIAPKQTQYSAYHAVVLSSIKDDGTFRIFDSLTQKRDFDGFHELAPDYEILSAFSFIDLPNGWEKAKEEVEGGALDHYGKKRVLSWEVQAATMLSASAKINPTLSAFMGRDWTKAINAVAYGGYSVQDLLNHWTSMRRGHGPIFDLDRKRR